VHHRAQAAARGHRATASEERGLISVAFVGSFPRADFALHPPRPEIGFLGRSNVGKSSLINKLVQRRALARTSRSPGKTRACNVYDVASRYYLVDLPGYGYARTSKSDRRAYAALIRAYLSGERRLAGIVWLLDVRRDPSSGDLDMAALLTAGGVPALVAITKADKLPRGRRDARRRAILEAVGLPEDQCVVTSTRTGDGIDELRIAIDALIDRSLR